MTILWQTNPVKFDTTGTGPELVLEFSLNMVGKNRILSTFSKYFEETPIHMSKETDRLEEEPNSF